MSDPLIQNPYNQILGQKHGETRRAQRIALGTECDAQGKPKRNPAALRKQLKLIQINAATVGDNILIPAGQAGAKQIFEVVLWNVTQQTLIFTQGATGANPITLMRLTTFPDLTGFTLGFNGSFDQPHWEIDNGQPLILNIDGGTQVDGFIRYRVQNGTDA